MNAQNTVFVNLPHPNPIPTPEAETPAMEICGGRYRDGYTDDGTQD